MEDADSVKVYRGDVLTCPKLAIACVVVFMDGFLMGRFETKEGKYIYYPLNVIVKTGMFYVGGHTEHTQVPSNFNLSLYKRFDLWIITLFINKE